MLYDTELEFSFVAYSPEDEYVQFGMTRDADMMSIEVWNDGGVYVNHRYLGYETWTFTLEDGSTVKKKVYVG